MWFVAGFSPRSPQFNPHLQTLKEETKLQLADELGTVRQRRRKTQRITPHSGVQDFHAKFFPPFAEMASVRLNFNSRLLDLSVLLSFDNINVDVLCFTLF
jgi:hypothetical protein